MDDLDLEIAALEELIDLQKSKVQLLRRKRCQLDENRSNNFRESYVHADSTDKGVELVRTSHSTIRGNSFINTVTNVINSSIYEEFDPQLPKNEKSEVDDKEMYSRQTGDPSKDNADDKTVESNNGKEKKRERFVDALTRLSRLSTDLANERTFLAWIRTALASARTVVSFLGLTGTNEFGRVSVKTCVIGFAVLALLMMLQGTERYKRIKDILLTKDTPAGFARLTTIPINLSLLAILLLVVIVTSSDKWVH